MREEFAKHTDTKLWQAFKNGDKNAFSAFYHTYYRSLYNYGYAIIRDKELIKDVLQELFMEIWRDREKLGEVQSVRVYLLVSFRRKLFFKIAAQKKKSITLENNTFIVDSYEMELITSQQAQEQKDRLVTALDKLPKRQKEALYLRFYQELTYDQMIQVMDLQYQTVRDLIHKGIKTLRKNLLSLLFF
jgi:RNA polymerase sigma factor (sigma-70 family)